MGNSHSHDDSRLNVPMKQVLLTTPKFSVERREISMPGQGNKHREIVVHPGAVLIIPFLTPTTLILIYNRRYTVNEELLELPAGTMEPPEKSIVCAARELEEETGYSAGQLEHLYHFYTTPGFTDEKIDVFVAMNLKPTQQNLDPTEQIRTHKMELTDALAATVDGRIVDAKTIAALHIYNYRKTRAS